MKSLLGVIFLAGVSLAIFVEVDPGTPASIEEFPAIVQVEVGYGPLWLQGCAGSIITNVHILSSARCFSGLLYTPQMRRIRYGSSRTGQGDIIMVQREHNHPTFGAQRGFDGDITVVRLLSAFSFGSTVQQTPIVSQGSIIPDRSVVFTAGWGSTAQGKLFSNRQLHSIDLVIINNAACAEIYANLFLIPFRITVTSNMVCSGRANTGGRIGDLRDGGAPLYFNNALIGVQSFGYYINNETVPVVYTSVSSYTDWIVATAV